MGQQWHKRVGNEAGKRQRKDRGEIEIRQRQEAYGKKKAGIYTSIFSITKHNKTRQDKTRQGKARPDQTRQHKMR